MIQERVRNLTAHQREVLARRLQDMELPPGPSLPPDQLVAWYTSDNSSPEQATELAAHLRQRLPAALVPRHLLRLDALPRTATGKVDRQRLSQNVVRPSLQKQEPATDVSHLEQKVFEIFAEVLGHQHFSSDDSFFEAGGDSLSAISVIALCVQAGFPLTLQQFHACPTVRGIARTAHPADDSFQTVMSPPPRERASPSRKTETSPSVPHDRQAKFRAENLILNNAHGERTLYMIPPRGSALFAFHELANSLSSQPCRAIYTRDTTLRDVLSIGDFALAFVEELKRLQPAGPYHLVGMCEGAYIAWEMARLLDADERSVEFLGIIDTAVADSLQRKTLSGRIQSRLKSVSGMQVSSLVRTALKRLVNWLHRSTALTVKRVQTGSVEDVPAGPGTKMGWQYRPGPYAGNAVLFRAAVPPAITDLYTDFDYGWSVHAMSGLRISTVPCCSDDMMKPEFVGLLSARIVDGINAERGQQQE